MLDTATGEVVKVTLKHEGNKVREFYSMLPRPVRVRIEATGSMQWFVNLMEELGIECLVGHTATIRAAEPPTGTVLNTGERDTCHRLRISGASRYERGAPKLL